MKAKELFKMVEESNKLKSLLGEKLFYVSCDSEKCYTFKDYKKLVHSDFYEVEFEQDTKYKNYFVGSANYLGHDTEIEISINEEW